MALQVELVCFRAVSDAKALEKMELFASFSPPRDTKCGWLRILDFETLSLSSIWSPAVEAVDSTTEHKCSAAWPFSQA